GEVVTEAFCKLYRIPIDKRSAGTLPYLKTIDERAPGGVHPFGTARFKIKVGGLPSHVTAYVVLSCLMHSMIILGIKWFRKMGAVLDFAKQEMIFTGKKDIEPIKLGADLVMPNCIPLHTLDDCIIPSQANDCVITVHVPKEYRAALHMFHGVTIPHGLAIAKHGLLVAKAPIELHIDDEHFAIFVKNSSKQEVYLLAGCPVVYVTEDIAARDLQLTKEVFHPENGEQEIILIMQDEPEPDMSNLLQPLVTSNDNIHLCLPAPMPPSIIEFLRDTRQFSKETELVDDSARAVKYLRKSKRSGEFHKACTKLMNGLHQTKILLHEHAMTERMRFANTQNMEDSGTQSIEFQTPTSVLSPGSDEKDPFNGLSELDYNPVIEMLLDLPPDWLDNSGFPPGLKWKEVIETIQEEERNEKIRDRVVC
ncbi:hypothetical protein HK096_008306, partial [Nowakowskiella sp. JEL0078]